MLPLLALLCLAGSVFLSRSRRRGLLHAAIGVALSMLLLVAALGVARSAYLDALGQGALPRDAASDIFDALVTFLRDGLRIVIAVSVAFALLAFMPRAPARAAVERAGDRLPAAWIAEHRNPLLISVGFASPGCAARCATRSRAAPRW